MKIIRKISSSFKATFIKWESNREVILSEVVLAKRLETGVIVPETNDEKLSW